MGRTVAQYDDRIRSRLGDLGVLQHFRGEQTTIALEEAVNQLSNDMPRQAAVTYNGDSLAYDFALPTTDPAYTDGWSRIESVEYPKGDRIPVYLEETFDWIVLVIAGAATLRLKDITPTTGNDLEVIYTTTWTYPTDDPTVDLIPHIYSDAVCSYAASVMARGKGAALAAQQSASVVGQLQATNPEALFAAAGTLRKAYETTVLGRPAGAGAPPQTAIAVTEIDVFPNAIFHGRNRG